MFYREVYELIRAVPVGNCLSNNAFVTDPELHLLTCNLSCTICLIDCTHDAAHRFKCNYDGLDIIRYEYIQREGAKRRGLWGLRVNCIASNRQTVNLKETSCICLCQRRPACHLCPWYQIAQCISYITAYSTVTTRQDYC